MSYNIKPIQKTKARKLGVEIKPSTNKKKKLDVFKGGKKIASIGAMGYMDYASYIKDKGKEIAEKKRAAYKARHKGEEKKIGSPGYYAWFILW